MYVLLTEIRDWNEEFDTESFIVMPKDKFEKYKIVTDKALSILNGDIIKLSFGTNQAHFINNKEHYWNNIKIIEINKSEFLMLQQLFGHQNDDIIRFGTNSYFFPLDNY
jgi:hypothetical protein